METKQMIQPPKERNMGIELFRVAAMMLVVTLHVLGHGGFTARAGRGSATYHFIWYLETLSYCAVDCYALISGYVGIYSSTRIRRILFLWLEVFTLGVGCGAAALFLGKHPTGNEWLAVLFPLSNKDLWYLNAYFILFFLTPILNKGLKDLDQRTHAFAAFAPLTAIALSCSVLQKDVFLSSYGFSALWLIELYVVGAYFRKYGFGILTKRARALTIALLSGSLAYAVRAALEWALDQGMLSAGSFFAGNADFLVSYVSPCMVIMAIGLLAFFSGVQIRKEKTKKIVAALAKGTFGVFALHVNTMYWNYFLMDRFAWAAGYSAILQIPLILGIIVVFYLEMSAISLIRIRLFEKTGIHNLINQVANRR